MIIESHFKALKFSIWSYDSLFFMFNLIVRGLFMSDLHNDRTNESAELSLFNVSHPRLQSLVKRMFLNEMYFSGYYITLS